MKFFALTTTQISPEYGVWANCNLQKSAQKQILLGCSKLPTVTGHNLSKI